MAITRMTVIKASSDADYRKGQDIFLIDKRIKNFETDINTLTGTPMITATVLDADGSEHETQVSIDEDESQIVGSLCSCSDFYQSEGLCCHCVAILLKYISRRHIQTSFPAKKQNRIGQTLIESYIHQSSGSHYPAEASETKVLIELEPILHKQYHKLSVDFKIGTGKKYVIKDLLEFARLIRQGELFQYGKNLKFFHEPEAFTTESRNMLAFIMQRIEEYEYHFHCVQDSTYRFQTMKALRYLPLSPTAVDMFLNMMIGHTLQFDLDDHIRPIYVTDGDPELTLELKAEDSDTYHLTIQDCLILSGARTFWILKDKILYRCSEAFKKDMQPYLTELNRQKIREITLSEKQLRPFYGSVLKHLEAHTDFHTEGVDLTDYEPPEAHFSIYLDNPAENIISCTAYARYGEETFSLATPISCEDGFRDAAMENRILTAIQTYFQPAAVSGNEDSPVADADFIISHDDQTAFLFLEQGLPHFYELAEVFISSNMKRIRILSAPRTAVGVSVSNGLLEIDIHSDSLPYEELAGILNSYRRRQKYYKLKSGEFLKLENNSLSVLSELADGLRLSEQAIRGGRISVPLYRASYIDAVLTSHNSDIQSHRDRYFKSLIRDMKSVADSDYEVPDAMKPILRDYQKTGYRWLCTIAQLGFGGILADDMGLGKTLQIITLLEHARLEAISKTVDLTDTASHTACPPPVSLIVCPSSLVYNWDSEIEHFAPNLKTLLITGTAQERQELLTHYADYDVLITSYDMLKRDIASYDNLHFHYQIIDEAQYIKNHRTQAARSVCSIHSVTRFALTGTPIENRLSEFWSIFEYLMPGFLYPYAYFRSELEQPIVENKDQIAATRLQQLVRPFIMRRLKTDVLKELPDKLEHAVYAQMTDEQNKLYTANTLKLQKDLEQQSDSMFKTSKIQILAELTKLRQLCCDPSLIYQNYHGGSAKLDTCIQLIENAMAGGHKILLFSQFTSMLDVIERRLKAERILYYRLDGSTKSEQRTRLVNAFNENKIPVFLISLKAGGTGLNLTGADIVIHYDPWWNAAAQNQATDRAHRIGQTHTVTVYKLIARHTIEEKILELQENKKTLSDQILSEEGVTASQLTKEELLKLLQN
ncbi:DEAD/DEAH box helicase [Coprococcus catus]|uniref:DEAD/DEAH box helicase n=1 Tax=Coprococcus catus TaxID=116085 RepID=UPI0020985260|nr:DEAD/DEAH box helicase [Coprococcus catus]MCO7144990.1 DEAD/DEAH box helicase [Coprococcus catus]